MPDVALKTSWFLVPKPIKMIYKPQWMQSGQGGAKMQRRGIWACNGIGRTGEAFHLGLLVTHLSLQLDRVGVERGEATRKEARSKAKQSLATEPPAFYFYKPGSCLSYLHTNHIPSPFCISGSLFSRITALLDAF